MHLVMTSSTLKYFSISVLKEEKEEECFIHLTLNTLRYPE